MTAPLRIFVPRDTSARAVEADAVAQALVQGAAERGLPIGLIRNGSRGLFWLEPLVEVHTPQGRIGWGPVAPEDVPGLLDAGLWDTGETSSGSTDLQVLRHPLCVGVVDDLPFLARQQRHLFRRVGVTDPLSLNDYESHGGWQGLRRALQVGGDAVIDAVKLSGLRGRGGAAFPAGIKWGTVAQAASSRKHVVCNADEGDSGTYADRLVMEGDPYLLIEGMVIAALAVGAEQGWIYIRSEYPGAIETMNEALARAEAAGWLGDDVAGSGRRVRLEVRVGAGAYVCGEETALLESLEGRRGLVRAKPPLPALQGLWGEPTLIHNVLTLAAVPAILAEGAEAYRVLGVGRSHGTLPFQLAGNVRHAGLVELPFGATLRTLLMDFGGGTRSGRPIKAVQVGGPLGAYVPESQWDVPMDYESYAAIGATVGHGGIVVHDDTADMAGLARFAMAFCAHESCGKCTPCRIGSVRGVEVIDRIRMGEHRAEQVELLRDLCDTMRHASLCAMGGMTPNPVLSALDHYPEDFGLPSASGTAP